MKELKNYYGNGLNYDNISFSDYFRTLSGEGRRQGFVSEKRFNLLKNQIGGMLTELISKYTGDESTSVMKETANDIFVSLMYCFDIGLFSFNSHEDALEYILENDIGQLYKLGQKNLKQSILECVGLLVKAKSSRINYPDRGYNAIFDGEILQYLKSYDTVYFAHGTKRMFSYRSVNGTGGYRGILNLRRYLENLIFENKFVNSYGEEKVQNICYGYCEKNGTEYNDMGTNIYSLVLMNGIFAAMAGNEGIEVNSESAAKTLKLLRKLPETEVRRIVIDTADKLYNDPYVHKSIIKLAGHIVNAVNNNDLNSVIYIGAI